MINRDLKIKVAWQFDGKERVDNLKLHITNDGSLIVEVQNGKNKETGRQLYCKIRLDKEKQKEMVDFMGTCKFCVTDGETKWYNLINMGI